MDSSADLSGGSGGSSSSSVGAGGSGSSAVSTSAAGSTSSAASSGAGGSDSGWVTLISGSWKLPPGSEDYFCVYKTLDKDYWISGFESINPGGTHHTVLTVGGSGAQDGIFPCDSFSNKDTLLFGSGVGTNPLEFPPGVAVHLSAGQQILLNLHVFNASGSEISGESGTRARLMPPGSVQFEAESILAGTLTLSLPPNQETKTVGVCTMQSDSTLFAVQPHMHQLGTHMKMTLQTGSGDVVLHDAPYDFSAQSIYPIAPVDVSAGDVLRVDCTHQNVTNAPVYWGESSTAEMCHGGIYQYPATNQGYFFCMN